MINLWNNTRLNQVGDTQRERKNGHVIKSRDVIMSNLCESWKGVQMTFFVEMEF